VQYLSLSRARETQRTHGGSALRGLRLRQACEESLQAKGLLVELTNAKGPYFAYPTAVIDPGSEIGKDTKIWHFSHVMSGARVGQDCNLGQNVVISSNAKVGNNVKIQNNVSVYDGVEHEDNVLCVRRVVVISDVTHHTH